MDILLMMKFPSTKRAMETKNLYLKPPSSKDKETDIEEQGTKI